MVEQLVLGDEEVTKWVKRSKTIRSIVRLPGDASTRRYYRIDAGKKTYILMRMEPFGEQGDGLPFLVVQKHLAGCGVDVPGILDVDSAKGFVLLEALGDVTLLRRLQEVSSPDVERHLYERVIDSLIHLQVHASPKKKKANLEAFRLRFDQEKLMWEINFTIEHFYKLYLKRQIKDSELKLMQKGFSEICGFLADQPIVLTHRDFHSRNIMVTPGDKAENEAERLVMIDFQDG
jgi:aminoglycoside/choline kinase family phosphotransferase